MDLFEAVDEFEALEMLHDLGCTDGLPVVVPTPERVDEMLAAAPFIAPGEVIGVVPPRMGRTTVTDVAVSAVMAGCLPVILQIPVFYSLYKVLTLAIEMRHQPFALWIKDLSAPDPAHILNLFGLLPFEVPGFLGIGVLAILLGITMFLQFKLNPAPADPVQQQMFAIMPWVLMFVMAPFAAGLLLYWTTSNILTIAQQKLLYAKHPALKEPIKA